MRTGLCRYRQPFASCYRNVFDGIRSRHMNNMYRTTVLFTQSNNQFHGFYFPFLRTTGQIILITGRRLQESFRDITIRYFAVSQQWNFVFGNQRHGFIQIFLFYIRKVINARMYQKTFYTQYASLHQSRQFATISWNQSCIKATVHG